MAAGGNGPEQHSDEGDDPEADAIHPEAPDGIGQHVAEAEDEDGVAVLGGREMKVGEDGRAEDGEYAAVDVAEEAEEEHGDAGGPEAKCGFGLDAVSPAVFWSFSLR
ncbi:MAG TPA: hypothetical protein VK627_09625 [Edaphobacter sp.]|nr:hypothetical protein [Edaphobacter sp.]